MGEISVSVGVVVGGECGRVWVRRWGGGGKGGEGRAVGRECYSHQLRVQPSAFLRGRTACCGVAGFGCVSGEGVGGLGWKGSGWVWVGGQG